MNIVRSIASWPMAGKVAAVAVLAGGIGGGAWAATSGSAPLAAVSSPSASSAAVSAPSPSSSPLSSGLSASCQVFDGGQPVSQQDYDGNLTYTIVVTNGTSASLTVSGFTATFSAFGSVIDTETPAVNTALMEPAEKWTFSPLDFANAPQVSENTALNEICDVTEVDTADGQVTPSGVSEPDGQQNTQQTKDSQDYSTATGDISTLQSDAGDLPGDVSNLSGDVSEANTDLATTKSDASQGQGTDCENVQDTVYNDASDTLYNDQTDSTSNDAGTLQQEIGTVRSDIAQVNSDLQTLTGDGVVAPSNASSAISAAQSAIASATSQGNADINAVESDVSQGYSVANGLATGACDGDGPGSPPSAIQPLS
ncbi:MAG: hypothetical protein ABSA93_30310 [Streptosporangiaceae bacterium]